MTYVLWVNLALAILISIFGFYKTFKKWFKDKEKDDPEFPRNSGNGPSLIVHIMLCNRFWFYGGTEDQQWNHSKVLLFFIPLSKFRVCPRRLLGVIYYTLMKSGHSLSWSCNTTYGQFIMANDLPGLYGP